MGRCVVKEEPVYEDFEPFCKWQHNEDQDTLEIHVKDFKKEQLKVLFSKDGILKISGERPLDALTCSKFYKEVPLPSNKYDTCAVHAKFVKGTLILTLPKVTTNEKVSLKECRCRCQCQCSGRRWRTICSRLAKVAASLAPVAVAVLVAYFACIYKPTRC